MTVQVCARMCVRVRVHERGGRGGGRWEHGCGGEGVRVGLNFGVYDLIHHMYGA